MNSAISHVPTTEQSTVALSPQEKRVEKMVHIKSLTSMRFLAATLPILSHCSHDFLATSAGLLQTSALEQCVSFFFVLSGFILASSYPRIDTKVDRLSFWAARIARVYPAYLFALIITCFLSTYWRLPVDRKFPFITVADFLMAQAWVPNSSWYFSLNATSWTVSTEFAFYLLFPVLIHNWDKNWKWKLGSSAGVLAAILSVCAWIGGHCSHAHTMAYFHGLIFVNPCARLFEFVLGMSMVRVAQSLARKNFSVATLTLWEIGIFVCLLANMYITPLLLGPNHMESANPLMHYLQYASGAPLYAAIIALLSLQKGWVSRLLSVSALVFLGEISYSIYIFHWLILQKFQQWFTLNSPALSFGLYSIMVLTAAVLGYNFVEQPSRRFIRKLVESHKKKWLESARTS